MLQEQYIFLHDALLEALKCGETTIPCKSFRTRYAQLCQINPETGRVKVEDEFEVSTVRDVQFTIETDRSLQPMCQIFCNAPGGRKAPLQVIN